jgi:hypothetical protein
VRGLTILVQHICGGTRPEELPDKDAEANEDTALDRAYELISDWSENDDFTMQDYYPSKGRSVPTEWFVSTHLQPEDLETVTTLARVLG